MDIVIPNATSIGVFSLAAVLLLLTPGPAVLYIVARSVEQGRIAGLASVCGITTGTLTKPSVTSDTLLPRPTAWLRN